MNPRPAGEWDNEPDELHWIDDATGLRSRLRRNVVGALCGYVEVPTSHPHFGCNYEKFEIFAHGGLTYSAPAYGQGYEVGFDCAHYDDISPDMLLFGIERSGATYKNVDFVRQQCAAIAQQLYDQS